MSVTKADVHRAMQVAKEAREARRVAEAALFGLVPAERLRAAEAKAGACETALARVRAELAEMAEMASQWQGRALAAESDVAQRPTQAAWKAAKDRIEELEQLLAAAKKRPQWKDMADMRDRAMKAEARAARLEKRPTAADLQTALQRAEEAEARAMKLEGRPTDASFQAMRRRAKKAEASAAQLEKRPTKASFQKMQRRAEEAEEKLARLMALPPKEKIVEKPVVRIVEKEVPGRDVIRTVTKPMPEHVERIAELEAALDQARRELEARE